MTLDEFDERTWEWIRLLMDREGYSKPYPTSRTEISASLWADARFMVLFEILGRIERRQQNMGQDVHRWLHEVVS